MALPEFQTQANNLPNAPLRGRRASGASGQAVGRAVEGLGQQLQLFAEIKAQDERQLAKFQATKLYNEAVTSAQIRLEEMRREAPEGAPEFTKQFGAEREKIFSQAKSQISPDLWPEFETKFHSAGQKLKQEAFLTEHKERDAYYLANIDDGLEAFKLQIDSNPDSYFDVRRRGVELIDNSGLPTTTKLKVLEQWKRDAAIARYQTLIRTDPENATLALGGRARIKDPEKLVIANTIRKTASKMGIDPDLAVALAYVESGLRVDISGPAQGTKIQGLFQLDADSQAKHGYKPGLEGNVTAGIKDMRSRIRQFRKDFGRNPSAAEYYIYHFQGIGAGKAILKSDNSESLYDVLADAAGKGHANRVFRSNPWLHEGMTVGQFKSWSHKKINNGLAVTGGEFDDTIDTADPALQDIPFDKRLQLRSLAEQEYSQRQAEQYQIDTRLSKQIEERTYTEGIDLYANDELTKDWVIERKGDLTPTSYRGLLSLAERTAAIKSDFDVYYDLLSSAGDDPEGTIERAVEAVGAQQLSRADFDKVWRAANSKSGDDSGITSKERWKSELVRYMDNALMPSTFLRTPERLRERNQKRLDFIDWLEDNPDATREQMREYVDNTISSYKEEKSREALVRNVLGRLGTTDLKTVTPQQLDELGKELTLELEDGDISRGAYMQYLKGINQIRNLVIEGPQ